MLFPGFEWKPFSLFSPKKLSREVLAICEPALYVFSKRFFGGRTRREALVKVKRLNELKRKATVNFLGEHITDLDEIRFQVAEYCRLARDIAQHNLDATISIKLTQLGLDLGQDKCAFYLETILQEARNRDVKIEIDMEDPRYVDDTIDIVVRFAGTYPELRVALQANLIRTRQDLERILEEGVRVRLCKGAYERPRKQFCENPLEVRVNYLVFTSILFDKESPMPALATHDIELLQLIRRRFPDRQSSFEFQMLYGVRGNLQKKLVRKGHTVRVYVPYGKEWLRYGIRRWKTVLKTFLTR